MEDPRIFANLVKGRQSRAVIVRVVRKWTLYQNTGQGAPLHVGMVLADEEGEAMYAQIDEELIQKKAVLFEPGKVYAVKKFMVDNNKRTHKTVDRELMINITEYTTIEVIRNPPDGIPHYIYNITPLSVIKPTPIIEKYLDVVGYLVKYEALQVFIPKNREKVKMLREIYIKDLSDNVMKITLWGDHAVNFNISNIYDPQAGNLIVCLVLGCSARKDFKNNDKTALTGSTSCSYYFNPTIPETAAFQNRFKDIPSTLRCHWSQKNLFRIHLRTFSFPKKRLPN